MTGLFWSTCVILAAMRGAIGGGTSVDGDGNLGKFVWKPGGALADDVADGFARAVGVSGAASALSIVFGDAVSNADRAFVLIWRGGVRGVLDVASAAEVVVGKAKPYAPLNFLLACLGGWCCIAVGVGGSTSMEGTGTS